MNEWPPSLVTYWHARYLLEPWDEPERLARSQMKYRPPKLVMETGRKPGGRRRLDGTEY